MEMKAMEAEAGQLDSAAGPSRPMLETKTEEKEDSKLYCKLARPSEDVYAEATFPHPPPAVMPPSRLTKNRRRAHVLVALCIVLGVICVGQLIAILILNGKTSVFQKPQASNVEPHAICNAEPLRCQCPQEVPKSPDSYRCPNDWEFFENSCFFLSKDRLDWTQSRQYCTNATGDLAVLSDQRIRTFVLEKSTAVYWIGLHYTPHPRLWMWMWVDNKAASEQPEGNTDVLVSECAALTSTTLQRFDCTFVSQFICQRGADAKPLRA